LGNEIRAPPRRHGVGVVLAEPLAVLGRSIRGRFSYIADLRTDPELVYV